MLGQGKLEGRADIWLAFERHPSAVRLDERLDDGETKAQTAFTRGIRLEFVEHFSQPFLRDPSSVVGHPAFDHAFSTQLLRLDLDLSARCVFDGVSDQVLKDPPQLAGVRVNDQAVRDFIDKLGAAGSSHWTKIVDEGLDQRPKIKLAPLEFDAGFRAEMNIFLEDLVDQPLQMLDVAAQCFQHLR